MSNSNDLGTPHNLDELTLHTMLTPMNQFRERVPAMIKDYVANKMAKAIIEANGNPELEKILMDLFQHITERKSL